MIDTQELQRITNIHQGQTDDFSLLYEKHFQPLYNHIYYKTLNQQLTEDIVGDSFLKAFDKIGSFTISDQGSFRARLYTIANHILFDEYKKKTPDWLDESIDYEDKDENITQHNNDRYISEEIMKYIDTLGESKKELLIMRIREGLSYEEIVEITGRSAVVLRKEFSTSIAQLKEVCWDMLPLVLLLLSHHY